MKLRLRPRGYFIPVGYFESPKKALSNKRAIQSFQVLARLSTLKSSVWYQRWPKESGYSSSMLTKRVSRIHVFYMKLAARRELIKLGFHSFVSMSAAYLDAITKQSTRSLSNWHHHARALRLISSKISKAQGVTDFALASVIALSLQESLRGQMQHAKLHVEGLFRMVEVRGGLEGLESNPALVEKVKR